MARSNREYVECSCGGWAIIERAEDKQYRDRIRCPRCGRITVMDNIPQGRYAELKEERRMAKHKHIPYVVLGADDKPTKGMIAFKMPDSNMYNLIFVELANEGKYDFGDEINEDDILGAYQSIIFADVRSVDAVIKQLQKIKKLMEQ